MKKFALTTFCSCINEKGIWFIHSYLPLLMFFDFSKQEITVCKVIPDCGTYQLAAFCGICETKEKVFLVPNNASIISIFDKTFQSFTTIDLEKNNGNLFWDCFVEDKYVYCLPYKNEYLLKIDIASLEIIKSKSWHSEVEKSNNKLLHRSIKSDNFVIFVLCETNQILLYDIIKDEWQKKYVGNESNQYTQIIKIQQYIYLFDNRHNKLYKYTEDFSQLILEISIEHNEIILYSLFNKVLIDSVNSLEWRILDENLNLLQSHIYEVEDTNYTYNTNYRLGCWKQYKNQAVCIDPFNHLILVNEDLEYKIFNINLTDSQLVAIQKQLYAMQNIQLVDENEFFYCKDFIHNIKANDLNDKVSNHVGKLIYENIQI